MHRVSKEINSPCSEGSPVQVSWINIQYDSTGVQSVCMTYVQAFSMGNEQGGTMYNYV